MILGDGWDWKEALGDFCGGLVALASCSVCWLDGCVHSGKMLCALPTCALLCV